jgi:hypothetical protein
MRREEVPWPAVKAPSPAVGGFVFFILFISKEQRWEGLSAKSACLSIWQDDDDDDGEALAVDPARRGPRLAPRGPGVFDDMLKKPCPYHKTPVNHTLEQGDMLKRFYGRAAAKDDEAKKDGGDGDAGGFPAVENVFLIFGGGRPLTCPAASASGSSTRFSPRRRRPLPFSIGRRTPSPSAVKITLTASPTQSSGTRGSRRS